MIPPTTALFKLLQNLNFVIFLQDWKGSQTSNLRTQVDWWDTYYYNMMKHDRIRVSAYQKAIANMVKDRTVVEIGTGDSIFLPLFCHQAGAKRIHTIEGNKNSFLLSRERIEQLNLNSAITIYKGISLDVEIDENCDLLLHEIVGKIGSCEGMVLSVEDAKRRFLKPNAQFIPYRCITQLVPCPPLKISWLDKVANQLLASTDFPTEDYRESSLPQQYNIFNFPTKGIVFAPQAVEDIVFTDDPVLVEEKELEFLVDRPTLFDGFALYIELYVDRHAVINSLYQKTSWSVIYAKLFPDPVQLDRGDVIKVWFKRDVSTIEPSYQLRSQIWKVGKEPSAIAQMNLI